MYVCTHTHLQSPFTVDILFLSFHVSMIRYDKKISRFSASCLWQASDCMAGTVGCKLLWRASAKFEPKQLQGKVDIRLVMACQSVMMSRCTSATSDVFYMYNRQAVGEQQASSRWAATGKQQQAAASSREAAGKQQASSGQAAGKQQPAFAPLKEWSNIF